MPPNHPQEDDEDRGKAGTHEREVLMDSKKEKAECCDHKLHGQEGPLADGEEMPHQRVELDSPAGDVVKGQVGVEHLEEEDQQKKQPDLGSQAIDIVGRRVREAPALDTAAAGDEVSTDRWGRAVPSIPLGAAIHCRHSFTILGESRAGCP